MTTDERFGTDEPWVSGKLVIVPDNHGSRMGIEGHEHRPFHAGDPIEIEVAPGIWLRGGLEVDHSTTIRRGSQDFKGYYLNIQGRRRFWIVPGMTPRIFLLRDWPQPTTPYEGQAWKSPYGGWKRYRAGQWVRDETNEE